MTIEAYPLQWPAGWTRTPLAKRDTGNFTVTLAKARDGVSKEIARLGGKFPVISSNLMLRLDGLPYANQRQPEDPGIAVYFEYKGKPMCFACDRYVRIEANLRAIELTIAALRGIERWGASDMMERAFTGFAALDHAPEQQWWDVLCVHRNASRDVIEMAYRRMRSEHHPDRGGDPEKFRAVQKAYEDAVKCI